MIEIKSKSESIDLYVIYRIRKKQKTRNFLCNEKLQKISISISLEFQFNFSL